MLDSGCVVLVSDCNSVVVGGIVEVAAGDDVVTLSEMQSTKNVSSSKVHRKQRLMCISYTEVNIQLFRSHDMD